MTYLVPAASMGSPMSALIRGVNKAARHPTISEHGSGARKGCGSMRTLSANVRVASFWLRSSAAAQFRELFQLKDSSKFHVAERSGSSKAWQPHNGALGVAARQGARSRGGRGALCDWERRGRDVLMVAALRSVTFPMTKTTLSWRTLSSVEKTLESDSNTHCVTP